MKIDNLNISYKIIDHLIRAGYEDVDIIQITSDEQLLNTTNLNNNDINELRKAIENKSNTTDSNDQKNENDKEYPRIVKISNEPYSIKQDKRIKLDIESAYWDINNQLYTPHIKIRITNKSRKTIESIRIKAIFYNTIEKDLWGTDYDYISYSSPLKPRYSKLLFLSSSIGYHSMLNVDSLPYINAHIFVDDNYYGEISISKTYDYSNTSNFIDNNFIWKYSFLKYDEREFALIVTNSQWEYSNKLFVPYLRIDVINQTLDTKSAITVKAVFYVENESVFWSEVSNEIISSATPLLPGYKKTAFLKGSQGYSSSIEESFLPKLYADIFVNDELYGQVRINQTYNDNRYDLITEELLFNTDTFFTRKNVNDYFLLVTTNCWRKADKLYVPYLKIAITNQKELPADDIRIKVVFYNSEQKEIWSETKEDLVDKYDTPLKYGFTKTAFIKASVGYTGIIDEEELPKLVAEIFINDKRYGIIYVNRSYSVETISQELLDDKIIVNDNYVKKDDRDYYVIVKSKYWQNVGGTNSIFTGRKSPDLYAPTIHLNIINQQDEDAKKLTVKAIFYNLKEKNLWSYAIEYPISSNDTPLKQGFCKSAFLKASVGYNSKIDDIPEIFAEIYINDSFYGTIVIDRSFNCNTYDIPLTNNNLDFINDNVKKNNMDFYSIVRTRNWEFHNDLYVPCIRLDIENQLETMTDSIYVKAIFYNEKKKEVWCEATSMPISSSSPLRPGFNVSAFLYGSQGYQSKLTASSLPNLTADIYINDTLYGSIKIRKKYDCDIINEPLIQNDEDENTTNNNVWNDKSFLGEMGYSTSLSDFERHIILDNAVNDYGKQRVIDHISFLVNMRLSQKNGENKFANAIEKWKADLVYIRNI